MSGLRPVSTGTQKVTFDESEREYLAQRKAAEAQADGNPYVAGIQHVFKEGAAEEVGKSLSNYGAPTVTKAEVLEGESSNFAQSGDDATNPNADPRNTTGNFEIGKSSTTVPQENPSDFMADELAKRMEIYRGTMPQSEVSLNNRAETMRG